MKAGDSLSHDGMRLLHGVRGFFFWAVLFSAILNLLILTGPLFMLLVYDRVLPSRSEETLVSLMALVTAMYLAIALLDIARGRILTRIGGTLQARLDGPVFENAVEGRGPGPQAPDAIRRLLGAPVFGALLDLPWVPVWLAAIAIFHPALGWLALAGGALLLALALLGRWCTAAPVAAASAHSEAADQVFRWIQGHPGEVAAIGLGGGLRSRWRARRMAVIDHAERASDRAGAFSAASRSLRLFLQSAMLGLGAWLVIHDALGAGAMVAASILLGRALAPIDRIVTQLPAILAAGQAWAHLKRGATHVSPRHPATPLPKPEARLSVRRLIVATGGSDQALLGPLSFDIPQGQVLGVLGASGAGKTTLARCLSGALAPTSGSVRLGGMPVSSPGGLMGSPHVGYLPQAVRLFPGSIAENIARMALAPKPDAVIAAARRAGVHDTILRLPDAYDTEIRPDGGPVSGGEAQRIALARAFFGDPALLVLDEPNASIDRAGAENLDRALRQAARDGVTVVVMTHRPSALAACDMLLVLDGGRLRAFGPRDSVLAEIAPTAGHHAPPLIRPAIA